MDYRVEELAALADLPVDTIRYYQSQDLLPAPRRVGRHAIYGEGHLERLDRIRALRFEGHTLKVIHRLVAPTRRKADKALRERLAAREISGDLSRAEIAAEAGVPEELVRAVEDAGLVEPLPGQPPGTFAEDDVELGRAAASILREGLPLAEVLGLAIGHGEHIQQLCERAAAIFERTVRRGTDGVERDGDEIAAAVRRIVPALTVLVAQHFHRSLVAAALAGLEEAGEAEVLEKARKAAAGRLEIQWR